MTRPIASLLRISFLLSALFAWGCLAWLLSSPSETASAVLFGFSIQRLGLAVLLAVPALAFSFWVFKSWKGSSWLKRLQRKTNSLTQADWKTWLVIGVELFTLLDSWILFFLPVERAILLFGSMALLIEPLKPLLLFVILICILWLPQVLFATFGIDTRELKYEKGKLRLAIVLFLFLLAALTLIALTGLGLGFDATIWNAPGAPLLSSQMLMSAFFAALVIAVLIRLRRWWQMRKTSLRDFPIDLGLAAVVWLLASLLWLAQPAAPTYYSSPPVPPNNQSYPLSDAFNHDVIANNVLIGEGFTFGGQVAIRRPAYVLFLAGLEGLLGGDNDAVIASQAVVLALFPALLYLLGSKLHNRFSGLLLASLIIFREANSIALGDVINTSHAKLLMADLPAALMMGALALAAVSWLRGSRSRMEGLLVGGVLGAAILLRSQTLTLLPFLGLLAVLAWGWRVSWRPVLLLALGAALVAAPWVLRNRTLTGQWVIEDAVVSGFLANRYSFEPGTYVLPFLPGESEGEYYARQMGQVREFTLQNPLYVAGFVADNFARNQILNFMAMPVSLQLRNAEAHVRQLPYWPSWQGGLVPETFLPMLGNLSLVGLGVAAAWKQARWAGLVPLFINLGFTANLSLARVSGWRYNLPADWTVLLYYALGLGQLLVWGLLLLRGAPWAKTFLANLHPSKVLERKKRRPTSYVSIRTYAIIVNLLLIAGSSFLIIEGLSQPGYSKVSQEKAASVLAATEVESEFERQQMLDLLSAGKLDVLSGRALHPRVYRAEEGIPDRDFVLVDPMDFDRLTFYLLGPEPASVVLPLANIRIEIPASSDVFVFRCGTQLETVAVIVEYVGRRMWLYVSPQLDESCPSPLSKLAN